MHGQWVSHWVTEPVTEPAGRPAGQSLSRSAGRSVGRSVSRSVCFKLWVREPWRVGWVLLGWSQRTASLLRWYWYNFLRPTHHFYSLAADTQRQGCILDSKARLVSSKCCWCVSTWTRVRSVCTKKDFTLKHSWDLFLMSVLRIFSHKYFSLLNC